MIKNKHKHTELKDLPSTERANERVFEPERAPR